MEKRQIECSHSVWDCINPNTMNVPVPLLSCGCFHPYITHISGWYLSCLVLRKRWAVGQKLTSNACIVLLCQRKHWQDCLLHETTFRDILISAGQTFFLRPTCPSQDTQALTRTWCAMLEKKGDENEFPSKSKHLYRYSVSLVIRLNVHSKNPGKNWCNCSWSPCCTRVEPMLCRSTSSLLQPWSNYICVHCLLIKQEMCRSSAGVVMSPTVQGN